MSAVTLFTAQTANGDSSVFDAVHREYSLIRVYGTFDGATVTAYADFDESGTYCILADGVWTSADIKTLYFKPGVKFKLTLSSAGASTSISAEVL